MSGPSVYHVPCPYCGMEAGVICITAGANDCDPHRQRWSQLKAWRRVREMVVEVLTNDDRLGVKAGEQYRAISYWLEPGAKVSLLGRIPDGYDPECNQYVHDVNFIEWGEWA